MKSFRATGLKDSQIHLSAEAASDVDLEKAHDDVGPLGYCESANLVFTDVRYRVPSLKGGKVDVLKGVSGACKSGRLLALMGASGAGKTSLIDILSGHVRAGVSGKITVNGQPFKAADFQKRSCYVLQRDVVLATATVKEAITTSALLRLPQQMSRKEKKQRVLDVIQQLELEGCANTLAGDDAQGIKGISGGERRRLSVAIGLVTDPQIILLDEPTSGLDSETAAQLIACLVRLARANRTVVASIHQPNSQITDCFDDLLLLAGGCCIYYGPWQSSVQYFASAGYVCPVYTNPSDFYLTISKDAASLLAKKWTASSKQWLSDDLTSSGDAYGAVLGPQESPPAAQGWSPEASAKRAANRNLTFAAEDEYIKAAVHSEETSTSYNSTASDPRTPRRVLSSSPPRTPKSPGAGSVISAADSCKEAPVVPRPATNWLFQMRVLFVRFVRTWYRTPHLLFSFLAQYIFAGIFMGLMYIQLGTSRASAIFDRQASLFLVLVMLAFTPSNTACTVWESERLLLRCIAIVNSRVWKEYELKDAAFAATYLAAMANPFASREANSGAYKLSTFFAAKTLVTFPMQALVTLLYCLLMYYITGYQAIASKFLIFLATCILFQLISETLGSVCAIVTKTATMGILLSSTLLMVLVAFSGFLINNTPVFFRWIPKMSFVTFAYSALYQNELNGLQMQLTAADGSMLPNAGLSISLANSEYQCLPTGTQSLNRGPAGNNYTIGQNLGILAGILLGLRLFTFVLLQAAYKLKKL